MSPLNKRFLQGLLVKSDVGEDVLRFFSHGYLVRWHGFPILGWWWWQIDVWFLVLGSYLVSSWFLVLCLGAKYQVANLYKWFSSPLGSGSLTAHRRKLGCRCKYKEGKNKVRVEAITWFGYVSLRLQVKSLKGYIMTILIEHITRILWWFLFVYKRMIWHLYKL